MKLEQAQELYSEYKEGTLSPAMKLALEQHFEADSASKADYEDFSRIFDLMAVAEVEEVEVPHGFRAKVMERAAAESAKRATVPTGLFGTLLNALRQPRGLQSAIALGAVAAVVIVSVVISGTHNRPPAGLQGGQGTLPLPTQPIQVSIDPSTSIVSAVSALTDPNGGTDHNFVLHLPKGMASATVDAYSVDSTSEIQDAQVRAQQATQIAKSQTLSKNEDLTISVPSPASATTGSMLNVVFDIHGTTVDTHNVNSEIAVFTPANPAESVSATSEPPANGKFFDSLQMLAAQYHVTVIVDASNAPPTAGAWMSSDSVDQALARVVGVGNVVEPLNSDTYFVYHKQ